MGKKNWGVEMARDALGNMKAFEETQRRAKMDLLRNAVEDQRKMSGDIEKRKEERKVEERRRELSEMNKTRDIFNKLMTIRSADEALDIFIKNIDNFGVSDIEKFLLETDFQDLAYDLLRVIHSRDKTLKFSLFKPENYALIVSFSKSEKLGKYAFNCMVELGYFDKGMYDILINQYGVGNDKVKELVELEGNKKMYVFNETDTMYGYKDKVRKALRLAKEGNMEEARKIYPR